MSIPAPLLRSSGDLIADRRYGWARDLEARGDLAAAADLLAQTIERAPGFASAWFALGEVRETGGDRAGAIEAFRSALAADPDDCHGAALRLVRLGVAAEGAPMSPAYVRTLFDQYAPRYDEALVRGLGYRGPELLRAAIERVGGGRPPQVSRMLVSRMLDLGCGSGLCGAAFRPLVAHLAGVDLSPAMIEAARAKRLYDRLEIGELAAFLVDEARLGATYDLVVAGDVFVYVDDLAPIMDAIAHVLAPSGRLAFTVETHPGAGVVLGEMLRFAHGADHVRAALEQAGLTLCALDAGAGRTESGAPVPGLVAVAERP